MTVGLAHQVGPPAEVVLPTDVPGGQPGRHTDRPGHHDEGGGVVVTVTLAGVEQEVVGHVPILRRPLHLQRIGIGA